MRLAKKRAQTTLTGPEPFCGKEKYNHGKKLLENEETEREALWSDISEMDHSKNILDFLSSRSKKYSDLSKNELSLLIGFLTAHCQLETHMIKIGFRETDECSFCEEETETTVYLVTDCLTIASLRKECLGHAMQKHSVTREWGLLPPPYRPYTRQYPIIPSSTGAF